MTTVHIVVGVAVLVLTGAAGLLGAFAWWRRLALPAFWPLLRAGQAAIVVQVALGCYTSLFYRWGADWYVDTAVPWLVSLVSLNPQIQYVVSLPFIVKAHMIVGFVVIALFPFSRLVHLIMFPFWYLWRPYQVVIRNRAARQSRWT